MRILNNTDEEEEDEEQQRMQKRKQPKQRFVATLKIHRREPLNTSTSRNPTPTTNTSPSPNTNTNTYLHQNRNPKPKPKPNSNPNSNSNLNSNPSPNPPLQYHGFPFQLCYVLLIVSFMSADVVHADWLLECGNCLCKWNSGKKTADCKNLSFTSIPDNLSPEVQVLDLSNNRIPHLEQNTFVRGQLHNLHKLYIRNSSLQRIDPRSFAQLEILIELDLSNNRLRSLQPNQFAHLVKVRALLLNGNLLESLGDGIFQNLNYLHRIELKGNRLAHVGLQVFVNLPMLSQIYLDENRLNFLRKESFENLKRLTALSLDQNQWNCTCDLQVFRDFVVRRNLYTPPTACYYPSQLRGMLWIENEPEAFACKPKIIYPARGASINTSKENVTLICRVHASSNTQIIWNHNKQVIRVNSAFGGNQRINIQVLRDEHIKDKDFGRNMFISRLTITGADKSDEGIYTCLAENAGGRDSVQMSLLVQNTATKELWLLQGNVIIVIGLMALGLLSVSFFLTMVTCCLYKRFKHYNGLPNHHRNHHHHHSHSLDNHQLSATGNVIVESTPVETGLVVCSTSTSTSNNNRNGDNDKTTTVGGYHHLIKQNSTLSNNRNVKKYTNCFLEESSYTTSNAHSVDLEKQRTTEPHMRRNNKDTPHFPALYDTTTMTPEKQGWTLGNNSKNLKENCTALPKEYRVEDFRPDLLTAYSNNNS